MLEDGLAGSEVVVNAVNRDAKAAPGQQDQLENLLPAGSETAARRIDRPAEEIFFFVPRESGRACRGGLKPSKISSRDGLENQNRYVLSQSKHSGNWPK